eukprot:NODE_2730_length_874_cov_83.258182_g2251_i0.p1 GENE.NODE_2730_length_874_cov_83.258182_g2251_i0~~NODE_2730_length_874_cov_83.258182_g2251_i0.p1  ORF type:complete len:275 (-),score=83.39 NODE_2730_length_874_cov_83.258182_g2251_i0:49-849(-)
MFVWYLMNWFYILYALLTRVLTFREILGCVVVFWAVWLCVRWEWTMQYNASLHLSAVIFPLSFSINAAYARRETALRILAFYKACAVAIMEEHSAWSKSLPKLPAGYVDTTNKYVATMVRIMRAYMRAQSEREKTEALSKMFTIYNALGHHNDQLRKYGLPPPLLTRPMVDVRDMLVSFEKLRVIRDYRTPSTIRAYLYFAIMFISIMISPSWAYIAKQALRKTFAYVSAVSLFALLQTMLAVQNMLDNPFADEADAINLDAFHSF